MSPEQTPSDYQNPSHEAPEAIEKEPELTDADHRHWNALETVYSETPAITFGGETFVPVPDTFADDDPATRAAIEAAADALLERMNTRQFEARLADFRALLTNAESIAAENDGSVPIDDLRTLLIDLLRGQK